jgi:hypothetical protein
MRAHRAAVLLVSMLGLSGCYGSSSGFVEAEYVPARVETYPHAHYQGRVVYLIGDRWYVRNGGVWFYYPTEPSYLYRYRLRWYPGHQHGLYGPYHHHYRRSVPPARHAAPPARRIAPPARESAPPARRAAPPARRAR